MGQADTLYILARQHQDDLMKVAEEARFAAAALTQRIGPRLTVRSRWVPFDRLRCRRRP